MRPSLRRLLDHPFDYAGLFPPAQYDMDSSVDEYLSVTSGNDKWIVDKFVCPATRLEELTISLRERTKEPIRATVIGTQHVDGAMAGVKHDADAIIKAQDTGLVSVEGFETRIPQGEGLSSAVAAAAKLPVLAGDGIEVYLEVGWGEGMVDAMHDAASIFEHAGFKARTGGTTADAFPSTAEFAVFISECAALECTFKYTAGMHEPIRYYDEDLGVYHHGFLNAILAGALASTQDLSRREIESVLEIDDPNMFNFGVDDIRVGEHWLEAEQVETFWSMFGGIGSCSFLEPLEGLRRLRLLDEVGA